MASGPGQDQDDHIQDPVHAHAQHEESSAATSTDAPTAAAAEGGGDVASLPFLPALPFPPAPPEESSFGAAVVDRKGKNVAGIPSPGGSARTGPSSSAAGSSKRRDPVVVLPEAASRPEWQLMAAAIRWAEEEEEEKRVKEQAMVPIPSTSCVPFRSIRALKDYYLKNKAFKTLIEEITELISRPIDGIAPSDLKDQLLEFFSSNDTADDIFAFLRLLAALWMCSRRKDYEPLVNLDGNLSLENWCTINLVPLGEYADHVQMRGLTAALGVPLRVENLIDRPAQDIYTADGVPRPRVTLLLSNKATQIICAIGRRRRRRRRRNPSAAGPRRGRNAIWVFEEPISYPPPPEAHSWKAILGYPMAQTVPNTCFLVASTVCLEAQHRLEFELMLGPGMFPCRAAAPRKLRRVCLKDIFLGIPTWDPVHGCRNGVRALDLLVKLGGAPTTNAPPPAPHFLPLKSWEVHYRLNNFTAKDAARLIQRTGPCVGSLFVSGEFFNIDASKDDDAVFRSAYPFLLFEEVVKLDDNTGWHAVVCYEYRHRNGELQILVLDNQNDAGPSRWVAFGEFYTFYSLHVDPMMGIPLSSEFVYPRSGGCGLSEL